MRRRLFLSLPGLLAFKTASAQTPYPTRTVRLMVGANAGGGTDIVARMLAEKLAELTGASVADVAQRTSALALEFFGLTE